MYHISQIQGMVLITATLKISLAKSQLPQVNICIDTSATQSIKSDVVVDRQSQSPEVSDHEEPNPWVHVLNSQFTGIMGNVWNRIHVYIYIYIYIYYLCFHVWICVCTQDTSLQVLFVEFVD